VAIKSGTCFFPDVNKRVSWTRDVRHEDATIDIAVLKLDSVPEGIVALPVASKDLKWKDPVYITGFSAGYLGYRPGYKKRQEYIQGNQYQAGEFRQAQPGDSGGPILSQKGVIVGVTSASDYATNLYGRHTVGAKAKHISRNLARWFKGFKFHDPTTAAECGPGG
jgi:S1-C subfamily serine protease